MMWGICLDIQTCDGKLFQRVIEYDISSDQSIAYILKPADHMEIAADKIKPLDKPPAFSYGEKVFPVNHTDMEGSIRDIIWHFKDNEYKYYISVGGRKKSRRYCAEELLKFSI